MSLGARLWGARLWGAHLWGACLWGAGGGESACSGPAVRARGARAEPRHRLRSALLAAASAPSAPSARGSWGQDTDRKPPRPAPTVSPPPAAPGWRGEKALCTEA